jgi:alpha 1,2-mannosyltransferase
VAFDVQAVILYNSQLYFRASPQPLDAPTEVEVHEDSKVSEPEVPEGEIREGAANAVMLMLARNSELEGAVSSVKQLEEKFNQRYHYPWVFLNEEPFSEEFKQ